MTEEEKFEIFKLAVSTTFHEENFISRETRISDYFDLYCRSWDRIKNMKDEAK